MNFEEKNIAWYLPRPSKSKYKGSMPKHCELRLLKLAQFLLKREPLKILNLFCGMNEYGFRIDLNPKVNPDLLADAHNFAHLINEKFNVIIADPPYSNRESKEIYKTPKLKYKKWASECDKVLEEGGLLIIYHNRTMTNPNPQKYIIIRRVFIGIAPNHSVRVALFFLKKIASKSYLYSHSYKPDRQRKRITKTERPTLL